jgi:hypothetical protein
MMGQPDVNDLAEQIVSLANSDAAQQKPPSNVSSLFLHAKNFMTAQKLCAQAAAAAPDDETAVAEPNTSRLTSGTQQVSPGSPATQQTGVVSSDCMRCSQVWGGTWAASCPDAVAGCSQLRPRRTMRWPLPLPCLRQCVHLNV